MGSKRRTVTHEPVEREHVPLYRSYGVTKRKNLFLAWLGEVSLRAIVIWILVTLLVVFFVGFFTFLMYGQLLLVTVVYLLIGTLLFIKLTKIIRKRARFLRKLARLCKKRGYTVERRQGFFAALVWSDGECDFTLDTGTHLYDVRFLTVRKYRSTLLFRDKGRMELTVHPLENRFTEIFGFKPRTKVYSLERVGEVPAVEGRKVVTALLVNPVCREMYRKERDGALSATGSGAEIFGMKVFTASGFLETVVRNEESETQ